MRCIKVKVSPGELGFVCKMITEYEGKIEIGSPLYLCDDGTVTPVENRNIVVGNYDASNQDEGDKTKQPPASDYSDSEFTKIQRLAIESCEASYEGDEWLPIGLQRLVDACNRLDKIRQQCDDLLVACRIGLNGLKAVLQIAMEFEAKGEVFSEESKSKHKNNIEIVETAIKKASK